MRRVLVLLVALAGLTGLASGVANADFRLIPPAPCSDAAKACVHLSSRSAWMMDRGKVVWGPTMALPGKPGFDTPPGSFRVSFKERDFWSTAYNGPMNFAVFFNGGMAFHEGSLRVMSHGCVHLNRRAAIAFFDYLNPGDVVEVVS